MPERIDGHVHFRVVAPFVTIVASTRTILTASASKTARLGCPPLASLRHANYRAKVVGHCLKSKMTGLFQLLPLMSNAIQLKTVTKLSPP